MLDKNLEYAGFARGRYSKAPWDNKKLPVKNFQRVKIIFEDDIGWYVESLERNDASGNGIRYSVKKSCFVLKARNIPLVGFKDFWAAYVRKLHPTTNGETIWTNCLNWVLDQIQKDGLDELEKRICEELGE